MQRQHVTQPHIEPCNGRHAACSMLCWGCRQRASGGNVLGRRFGLTGHASGPNGGIRGGTAGLEELAGVCECAAVRRSGRCNAHTSTTCNAQGATCDVQRELRAYCNVYQCILQQARTNTYRTSNTAARNTLRAAGSTKQRRATCPVQQVTGDMKNATTT